MSRQGSATIKWLSIVRVLGLFLVLIYHFFQTALPGGFLGVDMFFTLSGYLITTQLIDKLVKTREFSFPAFIKRRFMRIFPPLFCAILITLPFTLLISSDFTAGIGKQAAASIGFVTNIFEILTGGSYENRLLPHLFQHTWTLAVEMHFYIIWGLMFAGAALLTNFLRSKTAGYLHGSYNLISRLKGARNQTESPLKKRSYTAAPEKSAQILKWLVFAVSMVLALLSYLQMQTVYGVNLEEPSAAYFGTFTHGFPFILGAAAGALFGNRHENRNRFSVKATTTLSICAIVLSVGAIALLAISQDFYSETVYRFGLLCTALLTVVMIKCAMVLHSTTITVREPRLLTAVSSLSYCLYLFHWPLYIVFSQIININALAVITAFTLSLIFSSFVVYIIEPRISGAKAVKTAAEFVRERRRPVLRVAARTGVTLFFLAALALSGIVIARAPEISALEADLNAAYLYRDADAISELYNMTHNINGVPLAAPESFTAETVLSDGAVAPSDTDTNGPAPVSAQPVLSATTGSAVTSQEHDPDPATPAFPQEPPEPVGMLSEIQGAPTSGASPSDMQESGVTFSTTQQSSPASGTSPSAQQVPPTADSPHTEQQGAPEPTATASPAVPQETSTPSGTPAVPQESSAPSGTPAAPPETQTTAPPVPQTDSLQEQTPGIPEGVTIIGDSVCMGARRDLIDKIPNCYVDAEGNRQIWQGYNLIMDLQEQDRLREYIVVALGTNGNTNAPDKIEQIIADVKPGHRLVFVTPYDGRATPGWSSYKTAEYMRTLPDKYPFVTVADWVEVITPQARLLGSDKVHISGSQTAIDLYTGCIIDALGVAAGKPAKE